MLLAGATTVIPVDIASPNTPALTEYQAYRDIAGPPPGVRDAPPFAFVEP
jgi:hypothetical protein